MAASLAILMGLSIFCFVVAFSQALEMKRERLTRKLSRQLAFVSKTTKKRRKSIEEMVFTVAFWVSLGVLVGIFLRLPTILAALLGVGAVFVPRLLNNRRRLQKEKAIEKQLEGALLDMTATLWTNPSLKEAIAAARDEAQEPLRSELDTVLWEIDCGEGIDQALTAFAMKYKSSVLKMAVSAIVICRETGGNLAQVLERVAFLIRMRLLLKREVTALTSQQKMTAIAVSLIPIGFLLFTQILNPGYLSYLFTPVGTLLLLYTAISMGMGFIVLRRMSDLLPKGE